MKQNRSQKKHKLLRLFTGKDHKLDSATMPQPSQTNIQLSKWYQSINELPLNRFIDVACHNNLYALIIEGNPTPQELIKSWVEIHAAYAEAMGSGEHRLYSSVFSETAILAATYKQISLLIELLTKCCEINIYPEDLFKELNTLLHTSFVFAQDNMKQNIENLNRCKNRSKGLKIRLDLQQQKLDSMQTKKGEQESITKEYFISILLTLSDHAGYHISDSITVFEYCERVKRYNQYCEHLKSANARK